MGLKKAELAEVSQKLLKMRLDTTNSIDAMKKEAKELEEAAADMDSFDASSNNSEMNRLKNLQAQKIKYLEAIGAAITKVESSTFGECSSCGDDIPKARLLHNPLSIRCVSCQEDLEFEQKRGKSRGGINATDPMSSSSNDDE